VITADDYILGNGALHERFRLTTEILSALVSCAPRSLTIAQLQTYTGRPAKELAKLCSALWRAMLTKPDKDVRGSWTLACTPSAVTLEDVFRCVIADQPQSAKQAAALAANPAKADDMDKRQYDIDLLVSQATMAINQSVFRQLRQFSLDRLKVSAAAKPPSRRQNKYDNVHDFEVNPWFI
jgi:DNA-binding IscR family transcriptional regulator